MKTLTNNTVGFSLIEILFALALFSLLIFPVFNMFSHGSVGIVQTRNEVLAQQHASNLLSYLSIFPYNHENLKVGERDFDQLELKMDVESIQLGVEKLFRRKVKIIEIKPADWPLTYKVVSVVVSWKTGKKDKKVSITEIFYQ